jgi:ATP adenylyltransferase
LRYIWSPWRMAYIESNKSEVECVFCTEPTRPDCSDNLIVYRGQLAFVILNRYPYTSGHIMVVPFDHQPSLEMLDSATRAEMMELTSEAVEILKEEYHAQGFNIGINLGEAAGAGIVGHIHMHIVPRWGGDTNFMSTLSQTRVLPERLEDTYKRLKSKWTGKE